MRVDEQFMNDVGLAEMPEAEKQAFMEQAEEEFEVRVGQTIGDGLTDEQLDEFESIEDDNEASMWLDEHAPDFREKVMRVYIAFKQEISAERANILG